MNEPDTIKASTQDHLPVEDVTNNLILLKDGGAAMILKISAVNFNLLSEEEQDAIIYSYAALLNSLSFPIQILIRSQKKDITNYLNSLKKQEEKQTNPTLKSRISRYRQFVTQIVKERNVLDKKCYAIIPHNTVSLNLTPTNPLKKKADKPKATPKNKAEAIQKALSNLEPKRDHLIRQFSRIGLNAKQLATQELIRLLYTIYNPDSSEGVLLGTAKQYQTPITQSTHQPTQKNESSPPNPNQSEPA